MVASDRRNVNLPQMAASLALQKTGQTSYAGPCPRCGGTDRFWVNTREGGGFGCRGCGTEPDFYEACLRAVGQWEERDAADDFEQQYRPPASSPAPPFSGHETADGDTEPSVSSEAPVRASNGAVRGRNARSGGPVANHECTRLCGTYDRVDGTGTVVNHREDLPDGKRHWRVPSGSVATYVRTYSSGYGEPSSAVVLCEGEKAAWAVADAGLIAASWLGGSAGVGAADFSPLAGLLVVLWPDNDAPGQRAMRTAAAKANAAGADDLRVVDVSALPEKGDAADVSGATVRQMVAAAAMWDFTEAPTPGTPAASSDRADDVLARMIAAYARRLLMVYGPTGEVRLMVDGGAGVWQDRPATIEQWLVKSEAEYAARIADGDDGPAARRAMRGAERIKSPPFRRQVLDAMLRVYGMYSEQEFPDGLTVAEHTDLDADTRYLGAPNGVIDLHAGGLLPPEQGRATLTTSSVPHDFDPAAQCDHLDALLGKLPPDECDWLMRGLGYALRGWPSRRMYLLLGEAGGGKTTMAAALKAALGPDYCRELADGTLAQKSESAEGAPRPELGLLTSRRIAIAEEPGGKLAGPVIKKLTGDGTVVWRALYSNEILERRVTATIVMASNPESMPELDMLDSGLRERVRVLPYAPIPEGERDAGLRWRVVEKAASQAFLARLVWYAADTTAPPMDIPTVQAARDSLRDDRLGDAGDWLLTAIAPALGSAVHATALWQAAQSASGDAVGGSSAFGMRRSSFTRLARRIHHLPVSRNVRSGGVVAKGWADWRLIPPDEMAEEPDAAEEMWLLPAEPDAPEPGAGDRPCGYPLCLTRDQRCGRAVPASDCPQEGDNADSDV